MHPFLGDKVMTENFDKVIDRKGTYCTQWDYVQDRFGDPDVLPFSISDTDFAIPQEIQMALSKRLQHPIIGYTRWNHADFKNSIKKWFEKDNVTSIDPEWIVYSPSVVYTIGKLINIVSNDGDGVAVFSPMYDAFYNTISANKRTLIPVKLSSAMEEYQIDWNELEKALKQKKTKVLLLTNPHNPTGKVFSKEELVKINNLCKMNDIYIISDDIHRDVIIGDKDYYPITNITNENVALCCSGTKTFNTPGLIGSYAFIPDENYRKEFLFVLKQKNALSSASTLGIVSTMAGYNDAQQYVTDLCGYIRENFEYLKDFLNEKIPDIKFEIPEASYLAWLDVSELDMSDEEIQNKLIKLGKVGIMSGVTYGEKNYLRMNIGCPRVKLEEGLRRMELALH